MLGLLAQCGTPEYARREVVTAPDGVELLLDFKEAGATPPGAPLMLIMHGIGARGHPAPLLYTHLYSLCNQPGTVRHSAPYARGATARPCVRRTRSRLSCAGALGPV